MDYSEVQKKWKDDPIITEADLERKLDNFQILFAYHSCKIENAEITYQVNDNDYYFFPQILVASSF